MKPAFALFFAPPCIVAAYVLSRAEPAVPVRCPPYTFEQAGAILSGIASNVEAGRAGEADVRTLRLFAECLRQTGEAINKERKTR